MDYHINGFAFFLNVSGVEFVINTRITIAVVFETRCSGGGYRRCYKCLTLYPSLFWHFKKVETQFEQSW